MAAVTVAERSAGLAARRAGSHASVHSWELVTAVDGPGTRLTVFLAGCPLRCLYCHNPDTMAIRHGRLVSLDEVVRRLERYQHVFATTGGGLTLSGGEPLFQSAFVERLVNQAKLRGIHTALDTSGYLGARASNELLADLDLVLLDVKSGSEELYQRVTGRQLAPTLSFGRRLADAGVPAWVRFVLVPGLTDTPDNVAAVADIVAAWPNVQRVEVLPFHQMGRAKWDELGLDYQLAHTLPPAPEAVERARATFRSRGLVTY